MFSYIAIPNHNELISDTNMLLIIVRKTLTCKTNIHNQFYIDDRGLKLQSGLLNLKTNIAVLTLAFSSRNLSNHYMIWYIMHPPKAIISKNCSS